MYVTEEVLDRSPWSNAVLPRLTHTRAWSVSIICAHLLRHATADILQQTHIKSIPMTRVSGMRCSTKPTLARTRTSAHIATAMHILSLISQCPQVLCHPAPTPNWQRLERDALHALGPCRRDGPEAGQGPLQPADGSVPVQRPVQEKGFRELGGTLQHGGAPRQVYMA